MSIKNNGINITSNTEYGISINMQNNSNIIQSVGGVLYYDARKVDYVNQGTPSTTIVRDLTSFRNDATPVGINATQTYTTVLLPNGRTLPFLSPNYPTNTTACYNIPKTESINVTSSTENFAMCALIRTTELIVPEYLFFVGDGATGADIQYGVRLAADGSVKTLFTGGETSVTPAGTIVANTLYDFRIIRANGRLRVTVNGVETYNQPNTNAYTSKTRATLFAKWDGTAYSFGFRNRIACFAVMRGISCTNDSVNKAWGMITQQYK